jgi:hypothetical protein
MQWQGIVVGTLISLAAVLLPIALNRLRNSLGPCGPATARGQVLLDGPGLVDIARRIANVLVVFEGIHDGEAQRVALYSRTGPALGDPSFTWIAHAHSADSRTRLRAARLRTAQADNDHYRLWHFIHTDDDGPPLFWASNTSGLVRQLWRPHRIRCALMEIDGFWIVHVGGRRRAIETSAIIGVEAWASADLLDHELRLRVATDDGIETVRVARRHVALFEHTDEWDSNEQWVRVVGRALAQRLELPLNDQTL